MKKTLITIALILGLLIPSVALGAAEPKPESQVVLVRTPDVVVLDVTMSDKTHRTVIVLRGRHAQELIEECGCTGGEFVEQHIVVLLQPDIDI